MTVQNQVYLQTGLREHLESLYIDDDRSFEQILPSL